MVQNDVFKKTEYDKLLAKADNIDTSRFVLKIKYDTDKSELENKISDTGGLFKKTDYDAKITEIEGNIPDLSNLVTKTALTTVENKIPNVSGLATKAELNAIIILHNNTGKIHNIIGLISKSDHDKPI